jgi:hypothetical protein
MLEAEIQAAGRPFVGLHGTCAQVRTDRGVAAEFVAAPAFHLGSL